jgi:HK97 family phage prohead protease
MMREQRNCNFELRVAPESRLVEGYAIVFNSQSQDLGGFTEVIDNSALEGVIERSDVLCLLNHNEDKGVLARCKHGTGSLSIEIDDKGLKYRFEAPNTALGDELLEGLRRGDITNSSFAFTVGKDNWEKREDGSYLRTIVSI